MVLNYTLVSKFNSAFDEFMSINFDASAFHKCHIAYVEELKARCVVAADNLIDTIGPLMAAIKEEIKEDKENCNNELYYDLLARLSSLIDNLRVIYALCL